MTRHYLVTGGAGFIGSNYVHRLIQRNEHVTIFANLSRAGAPRNVDWLKGQFGDDAFRLIVGDVRNADQIAEAAKDADIIVHLAGQVAVTTSVTNPRDDFEANALGTFNALEAARLSGRDPIFIYASTNKVYGGMDDVKLTEEATRWLYADLQHGCPETQPLDFHSVRQAICRVRSELEAEAKQPGKLSYIGAPAIRARLDKLKIHPLPSLSSIERTLRACGLTHPHSSNTAPEVIYPHLAPAQPRQGTQVDIVTHYLPGGTCIACFNAIDVVSRYPFGEQYATRRSQDAADFLMRAWQSLGIPDFTQVDNEGCFSGGYSHPGVLGKVARLALFVGTQLVFSPLYHPESNAFVERFHQDYNQNVWDKVELATGGCQ